MALQIRSQMLNASDDVVFNATRNFHSKRKAYCSYGRGKYWIQDRDNLTKRDTFKFSGSRSRALRVGRTKSNSKDYHEIPKVFTITQKSMKNYRRPRDSQVVTELPAKWGPKWRKHRPLKKTDIGKDGKLKKGLVEFEENGKKYVYKGRYRNYQQEFIKRSIVANTSSKFYRGDLRHAVEKKIWKHLELDAMKKKKRRAAAKYYEAWEGDEEDEKEEKTTDSKPVNNEDLVEVD